MKRLSKHKFVTTLIPSGYNVMGGRWSAIYHFRGFVNDGLAVCQDCAECDEFNQMIDELIEVDDGFRREWQKRFARFARVPQRPALRAAHRRKREKTF